MILPVKINFVLPEETEEEMQRGMQFRPEIQDGEVFEGSKPCGDNSQDGEVMGQDGCSIRLNLDAGSFWLCLCRAQYW